MSAPDILCIGAAHWDIIGTTDAALPRGADRPGTVARSPGGVALNIARALAARGFHPALLTALGDDAEGDALAAAAGVDLGHALRLPGRATGAYVAIEAAGRLVAALADTAALHAAGAAILAPLRAGGALSGWRGTVVIDGNLAPEVVAAMADDPALAGCALRLVPASPVRAERSRASRNGVSMMSRASGTWGDGSEKPVPGSVGCQELDAPGVSAGKYRSWNLGGVPHWIQARGNIVALPGPGCPRMVSIPGSRTACSKRRMAVRVKEL